MKMLMPLAAAMIAAVSLAAPATAQKTIKHIPDADLKVLDPVFTTIGTTLAHGAMVFDVLYAPDSKWVYQPQMVESHQVSADGLTWTFKLRAGLKFHDGSAVEAKDVVPSIKRWGAKTQLGRTIMPRVADITALGADSFQIKLNKPLGPMLSILGTSANPLYIMREAEAKTDPNTAVTTMVGSGPFTFDPKDWNPGASVTYRKYKDYKPRTEPADGLAGSKQVNVDTVEWVYIPDPSTRVQALLRGEADTIIVIPPDLLPLLYANPNIEVRVMDKIGNQTMLRPNSLVPPFNNPKVRQALLYAVDQDSYLQVMQADPKMRTLCWAVFMCGTPLESTAGVDNAWAQPGAQADRAKALLQEAGYKNEPIILMDPTDQPVLSALTQISAQLMKQAGFNVDMQTMDWATLVSRRPIKEAPSVNKGGWHVFHTWGTGPLMSSPLMNSGAPTPCDGTGWFGWACDETLEKIRMEYLEADTPAKQLDVVNRYQTRFYETVPYVPLGQFVGPVAYRKELKGVIQDIQLNFWGMSK